MYYKVDPKLMTSFMDNARKTQKEMSRELADQRKLLHDNDRNQRDITEQLINQAIQKMGAQITSLDHKVKTDRHAEKVSEKLANTDPYREWKEQVNQTLCAINNQFIEGQNKSNYLDQKIATTSQQVTVITTKVAELSEMVPKIYEMTASLHQSNDNKTSSPHSPDLNTLTSATTALSEKITSQSQHLENYQHESRGTIDHLNNRQDTMFEQMRNCVREIKQDQEDFKINVPALIREDIKDKIGIRRRTRWKLA